AGSSTGKRASEAGSIDSLRARVRGVVQEGLEGELRSLLTKGVNDLEHTDSATALAFIDYCLAAKRGSLAAFMAELKPDETPIATFERTFKQSVEEVERDFRAWVREEY